MGIKKTIKNLVFSMMLLINIISFSEVPHSYVADNPNKAVTTAETIKRREQAEMNIGVTKVKTQEIEGVLNIVNKEVTVEIPELLLTDKMLIVDSLKNINSRQSLLLLRNQYNYNIELPELRISYGDNPIIQDLFIIALNKNNEMKFLKKVVINKKIAQDILKSKMLKIGSRSNEEHFQFIGNYLRHPNLVLTGEHTSELTKEVEIGFGSAGQVYGSHEGRNRTAYGRTFVDVIDANGTVIDTQTFTWWTYLGGDATHNGNIPYRVYYTNTFNRPVVVKMRWSLDLGGYRGHIDGGRSDLSAVRMVEMNFKYVVSALEGNSSLSFDSNYNKSYINFNSTSFVDGNSLGLENSTPGLSFSTTDSGIITMENGDILNINGTQVTIGASGNLSEKLMNIGTLGVKYRVENGNFRLALTDWGVLEPQRTLNIKVIRGTREVTNHTMTIVPPKRIAGTSRVRFVENYPTTSFVNFNGVSLDTPLALALESAVTGVTLEATTGHGIATMVAGDILEINGTQATVGASGNLTERTGSVDTLDFTYKVESGKLRLQLNNWGVLEPRRDIVVRVIRGTNEISRHTLETVSPRKVEGTTGLKYDETYQIRSQVKFNGIDLNTPLDVSVENLQGVTVTNTTGAGIPFMNQGDMIFIGDNLRRGETSYTIGTSGNLENRNIKVTNGEVGLSVDGGKLRLSLNNWTVNKNVNLNVRIVRGTNQIMQHTFNLVAPTAPFNVVQSGVLDFGTIIAGVKNRTAETDIKIEMIADVSSIEFKLNTDSPELVNTNGDILRAKNLRTVVRKQGDKTYLVKIQGRLDVPENQGLGEYSGTAIVEMLIR